MVHDARAIVAALKARFPTIQGPKKDDICYATQNRQDAVKIMAPQCEVVIVVGSPNSSNSNRLREVAQHMGAQAYMVDRAADLKAEWVAGKRRVGVTAGASAPQVLVDELIARLKALGAASVQTLPGITERVVFSLPARAGLPDRTSAERLEETLSHIKAGAVRRCALRAAARSSTRHPDDADAVHLAELHELRGEHGDALRYFALAERLAPRNAEDPQQPRRLAQGAAAPGGRGLLPPCHRARPGFCPRAP